MALSTNERQEEFDKILLLTSSLPIPEDMSVKELAKKSFELTDKLQLQVQKIFDVSPDEDERVRLAWHIGQIQRFQKELKENKYAAYLMFSYLASLSQGIKVYQREFNLV